MIGFIRNKSLPARRYLVLLVLPWCLMLLLTVAVLWPYLAGFRTTVKTSSCPGSWKPSAPGPT